MPHIPHWQSGSVRWTSPVCSSPLTCQFAVGGKEKKAAMMLEFLLWRRGCRRDAWSKTTWSHLFCNHLHGRCILCVAFDFDVFRCDLLVAEDVAPSAIRVPY